MRRVLTAFAMVLAAAFPQAAAAQSRECSIAEQSLFVRDVMSEIYLWYQQIPALDPTTFPSPADYLEAIRYRPIDRTFSYITSRAANDALFSSSQYVGFGLSTTLEGDRFRVTQVFPGGAAAEAGLERGDSFVMINGRLVSDLLSTGEIGNAFGPAEAGVTADIVFQRGEATLRGRMIKREVVIPTVSHTQVINLGGRRVGYIFFRNFVEPSIAALDEAFAHLQREHVTELVLDLRYNGGGLVNVAQHLGGLIGGTLTNGQVFAEYAHNDRNTFRNRTLRFAATEQSLTLNRVFAITTQASASASELVINALKPFLPVVVVGERTYGKPVGQYAINFCDKVLAPVSFALRNANGEGDFFGGLPPDCAAADDLDHQIGNPAEASLREAMVFMETGSCSPARFPRLGRSTGGPPRRQGWSTLVGAD
ncbi:MAG: S41 family peptidase [Vicinamibacterales bacterium]